MRNKISVALCIIFGALLFLAGSSCSDSPPVISRVTAENSWVEASETVEISSDAFDPDGDELTYIWSATGGEITGMSSSAVWTAPDEPGLYSIILSVRDSGDNEAEQKIFVGVPGNLAPVIESLSIEPATVGGGLPAVVRCDARDPEGEALQYRWLPGGGSVFGTGAVVTWDTPEDMNASTIKVEVSDPRGAVASMSTNIDLFPNHDPEIVSLTSLPHIYTANKAGVFTCEAIDADGDELEYFWTAEAGAITGNGTRANWVAPENCSKYDINVTVSDGRGGEATKTLSVTVAKTGG